MPEKAAHEKLEDDGEEMSSDSDLEQPLARKAAPAPPRMYGLDWMRITAIYLVVLFHVVQGLMLVHLWKGSAAEHADDYMRSSLQFGMPAFFYISGRAQALARHKPLFEQLIARAKKLLIPFVVCYILLVPPWLWAHHRLSKDVPDDIFRFLVWYWSPKNFFFDPAWLWFLPVLFIVTTWSIPLFFAADGWSRHIYFPVLGVQALSIWLFFSVLFHYSHIYSAFCIFGTLAPIVVVLLVPFPDPGQHVQPYAQMCLSWLAIRVVALLLVATSMGVVANFSYKSDEHTTLVCLYLLMLFYVQGYFSEKWGRGGAADLEGHLERDDFPEDSDENDSDDSDSAPAKTSWLQAKLRAAIPGLVSFKIVVGLTNFFMAISGLALLAASGTLGKHEEFVFPLYSGTYHNSCLSAVVHVLGAWTCVAIGYYFFWAYAKSEVHPKVYTFMSESTMIVYIFHWMFIKFFAFLVVLPLGMVSANGWAWPFLVAPLTLVLSVGGCLLLYMLFKRVPVLGVLFGL